MVSKREANDAAALCVPSIEFTIAAGDRAFADLDWNGHFKPSPANEHAPVAGFIFRHFIKINRKLFAHLRLHIAPSRARNWNTTFVKVKEHSPFNGEALATTESRWLKPAQFIPFLCAVARRRLPLNATTAGRSCAPER